MADLQNSESEHQVDVSISGNFRRVAIGVEASGIGLRKKGDEFIGSKKIPLADPIETVMTFKGSQGVDFTLKMTINGVEKKFSSNLTTGGVSVERCTFPFSDFHL